MKVDQQIWGCATGGAERVFGLGAVVNKNDQPLLYCAEHGRLCRHGYIRNQDGEYVEFRQGTNVVDTRR